MQEMQKKKSSEIS